MPPYAAALAKAGDHVTRTPSWPIRRQIAPYDHQIVQEIQKNMKKAGLTLADEKGQVPPSVLAGVFAGEQHNKNAGYVPPYDPRSK